VNSDAATDQAPSGSFVFGGVEQARVPDEWDSERPAVFQLNRQLIVGDLDVNSSSAVKITR
jgi:hypothetical protein